MATSNYDASAATEVLQRLRDVAVGAATDGVMQWMAEEG